MARTTQEIYDDMIAEKESFASLDLLVPNPDSAQTFLADLNTASKVGIWRLIFWNMAEQIRIHEELFDQNIIDVEALAKSLKPGVKEWYAVEAKKFQNGFSLVFNETDEIFEYTDTTSAAAVAARIISLSSARVINNIVTIKLAKTVASVTQKLTPSELASYNIYLNDTKIAGTKTITISDDPDDLKIGYTIEYDPQILTDKGVLISDGVTKPVQVAMDDYISVDSDGNQGLEFDATFRVQSLTDFIQAAQGVVSATVDVCEAQHGAISYTLILDVNTETYIPNSGYLQTVDETGTEATPVAGDVNIVADDPNFIGVYATTGQAYSSGDFVLFTNAMYKANTAISAPAGSFDDTEWDTVSNLTFVSI